MIEFLKFLLLFEIFLLPLIFATPEFGFEESKIVFFIFFNSLIGFLWWYLLFTKRIKFKFTPIKKVGLGFILILLITSLLGIDPIASIIGKPPYFQGVILYAYLYIFSLMVSSCNIKLENLAKVLTGSALIVSLLAIKEAIFLYILGIQIPNYAGRIVSSFGQPNLYAGFLLLTLPFYKFLLATKGENLRGWINFGFLVTICAIVLSYSRAAIFIMAGLLIFWLIQTFRFKRRRLLWLILMILSFFVFTSYKFSSGILYEEFIGPRSNQWLINNSPEKRVVLWPIILELVSQKPILGYGLENLDSAFSNYQKFHEERSPAYYGIKNLQVDRAHSYILDLLVFSGVLGLLGWLTLLLLLIKRAKASFLIIPLIIYLIWIQFQIQGIMHLLYFWLLVGLLDKDKII